MIILNDTHIGTLRSAGTTPASALALRGFLIEEFGRCLDRIDEDLVILGDLFDTYSIPMIDLLATYELLVKWLNKGHQLYAISGNHDLSTDSSKMSSFQFMCRLLPQATYVQGGALIADGVYAISHVANQDLFDAELAKVPKCKYLLVHANYDNNFAKEADHSLNLSAEQIEKLPVETVFFAHEHYYREARKVFVAGNQFPASISDCLHKDMKCMSRLTNKGIERIQTWDASDYCEMRWDDIQPTSARFIRFVGHAQPEQAAAVADVIARYRRMSEAFIVGNAVKIGTDTSQDEFELQSLEEVRAFDVMAALKDYLTEHEWNILKELK